MRTGGIKTIDRQGIAKALGWESWEAMLPLLYRDHALSAMEDLLGVSIGQLSRDLTAMGVRLRTRGGRNSKRRPESVSGQARAAGVSECKVHGWMKRRGYSINQAIEAAR